MISSRHQVRGTSEFNRASIYLYRAEVQGFIHCKEQLYIHFYEVQTNVRIQFQHIIRKLTVHRLMSIKDSDSRAITLKRKKNDVRSILSLRRTYQNVFSRAKVTYY